MPIGYSGPCRAKERIFFDGRLLGAGEVFELKDRRCIQRTRSSRWGSQAAR
jgi:hypothetical protein